MVAVASGIVAIDEAWITGWVSVGTGAARNGILFLRRTIPITDEMHRNRMPAPRRIHNLIFLSSGA
jgi:hypothetical protein